METFSTLPALHWSPVNSPHKGQWHRALIFSLIYAWTKSWVNNWNDGDLRRIRAHYHVTVMFLCNPSEDWAPHMKWVAVTWLNTLRMRQDGCHFPDNILKRIFLNENFKISIKTSLKFVPRGPINNIPSLVQIMAWHRPGNKPLSEPMMDSLLRNICITRPQWVKDSH